MVKGGGDAMATKGLRRRGINGEGGRENGEIATETR